LNSAAKAADKWSVEELEEDSIKKVALYARAQISPMAAFWGGIVAQEVVKYTGKYTPLKQWLHFDAFEIVPDPSADRSPANSRYDDQIAIVGREVHNKLKSMNIFLVGAGALGCEFLKALALMGVSSDGECVVTDDDTIEVSNLSR
jgi:ubiquitin-activating enzyme E1